MEVRRRRVVVVGAGFGGLAAARSLARLPFDVILVDANNYHTFQPLLYQVATAGLGGDDVCYPVRAIFARQRNARVVMAEVRGGDLDARRLELSDASTLEYDELVLACGAVTNSFGTPGVDEHAFGLKSLADALEMRSHLLTQFERADARPELIDEGLLTLVIVGGGPTGVELAGGMAELFDRSLRRDFPRLDLSRARIVLVEAADRLLRSFSPVSSDVALRSLESRGVEVRLNLGVAEMTGEGVRLADGSFIRSKTMAWAAGIKAQPLAAALGLPTDRSGRALVGPDLCVAGRPEVHVVGDLAAALDAKGAPLPQVAPVAIQEAEYTGRLIVARSRGEVLPAFVYRDKGSMATIGRHSAVTELPNGFRLSGPLGWLGWLFLHLIMLIGFRNKLSVLVNWAWNYATYDRASRIIVALRDPGH
ncbi:MAG TPA: NAD(P)/FAD-dependent oxidoreductase [Rectinemataceae bacterium]|nr:NAD(P)/FAD-dependent oxidoreductase [Rectinemataceae bacterium]